MSIATSRIFEVLKNWTIEHIQGSCPDKGLGFLAATVFAILCCESKIAGGEAE